MPTLRFASVDAAAFRDRAGVAAVLAAARPDVAVVHHSPHLARWRSSSAAIARSAGLVVVGGGRVGGANLVLSTLGVDFVAVADQLFATNPLAPAGVSVAQLRRSGSRFTLAGASLRAAAVAQDATSLRVAVAAAGDQPFAMSVVGGAAALADLGTVVHDRLVIGPSVEVVSAETGERSLVVADLTLPE